MKTAKDLKIPFVWEGRHPVMLDRFLYIPSHYEYQKQTFSFFSDLKPVVAEYCSGNGHWIAERAKQNPNFNWIAIEKRFERARQIWLTMHRLSIENLCVVCSEALVFTKFYAPEIVEAYVNFPDPWPKFRHAKHRLVKAEFILEVEKIMKKGGQMICVTDDSAYASQMMSEFQKCSQWKLLFNVHEWPSYGNSFFKNLWIEKGRTLHFLSHERQ